MAEPLISVVIPVYNLENHIKATLDSVFAQTYKSIEVIAVDDGSADSTPAVLDAYALKEARLKVIRKQNEGVSKARLTGVEAATGEYIGFVDGDDLIDPDMYERLLKNALEHGADISHCGYRLIKPDGSVNYFYNTGEVFLQDNAQGIYDLLDGSKIEPGLCNKLFRSGLFRSFLQGGHNNCDYKENEDLLMNYYLFKESQKSVFEDFCPYKYIIRKGSASHGDLNYHFLFDPVMIGEFLIKDTLENPDLHSVALNYYVTKLIKVSTASYKKNRELIIIARTPARKILRKILPEYIFDSCIKPRRKLLTFIAAYFPEIYKLIHNIYLSRRP